MHILVANSVGILDNGCHVVLFPSRWDCNTGKIKLFAYYPYELAYLSTLLKRDMPQDTVTMIDGNLPLRGGSMQGLNADQYAHWMLRLIPSPDVIVTECSALTFESMTRACMMVKEQTGCRLILTGPMGSYDMAGAKAAGWDDVVVGEYEYKVLALLQGKPEPVGYIDLDDLPWPEDEDISRVDYWEWSNPVRPQRGMIQVYATRGCPLSCTFCAVPLYYGGHGNVARSHRQRDPEDVCDEIDYLSRKYCAVFKGCFFNEETHNANPDWFMQFCETLIRRGLNGYVYDAMCGYWPFTQEAVELCAKAGYKQLRIGVESVEVSTGKAIKKKVNVDRLVQFMQWCKQAGVRVYGTFQIGAPGSSYDGDIATMKLAREWKRKGLMQTWQCSISTPQPGTPFYQQCKEQGWLVTDDLNRYNGVEPVVSYPHYPAEDIRLARDLA